MDTRHAIVDTELGRLTLVAEDDSLIGIYYPHHWTRPSRAGFGGMVSADDDQVLATARTQIQEYLAGRRTTFELQTSMTGNDFQRQVWDLLEEIPFGGTTTYGALAERLGGRDRARLVGRAVGANPLSIVVPCHRVVGRDGGLTGYAGGLARKQFLLELEGSRTAPAVGLF